jgi:hypothetical protein
MTMALNVRTRMKFNDETREIEMLPQIQVMYR